MNQAPLFNFQLPIAGPGGPGSPGLALGALPGTSAGAGSAFSAALSSALRALGPGQAAFNPALLGSQLLGQIPAAQAVLLGPGTAATPDFTDLLALLAAAQPESLPPLLTADLSEALATDADGLVVDSLAVDADIVSGQSHGLPGDAADDLLGALEEAGPPAEVGTTSDLLELLRGTLDGAAKERPGLRTSALARAGAHESIPVLPSVARGRGLMENTLPVEANPDPVQSQGPEPAVSVTADSNVVPAAGAATSPVGPDPAGLAIGLRSDHLADAHGGRPGLARAATVHEDGGAVAGPARPSLLSLLPSEARIRPTRVLVQQVEQLLGRHAGPGPGIIEPFTDAERANSDVGDRNAAILARLDRVEFVQRLSVALQRAHAQMPRTIELELHPPSLGRVNIQVTRIDGSDGQLQVTARIEVETSAARTLLTENLAGLERSLGQQGVQVHRFVVESFAGSGANGQATHQQGNGSQQPPQHQPEPTGVQEPERLDPLTIGDLLNLAPGMDRII